MSRKPFWLYPNLLSLDAPLVAVAWLHVFARTWRLGYHPWEAYVTLALAVWSIYVIDRLLDVSLAAGSVQNMDARHQFHQRHRKKFYVGVVVALGVAAFLVVTRMPMTIYKSLLLGGVLLAAYFGLAMLVGQGEPPLAKNMVAGVTFAFGTALTAQIYRPEVAAFEMLKSREFISFAVLCVLNIAAIDLWEHADRSSDAEIKASDELSLTLPLIVLGGAVLTFALLDGQQASRPFFYAVLTGAALLYILNRRRGDWSMDALRVLADVALLLPVLVFGAARVE